MSAPTRTREVLSPWQKPLVRMLVGGAVLLAGTGVFLLNSDGASTAATWALFLHIVIGALLAPVLIAFVLPHAFKHMRRKPVIGLTGVLVSAAALAPIWTGALMVLQRSALRGAWVEPTHQISGFALILLYAVHRRWGSNPASWGRLGAAACLMLSLGLGFSFLERNAPPEVVASAAQPVSDVQTGNHFGLSSSTTADGEFLPDATVLMDQNRCSECHPRIVEDTLRSAHKFASMNNPFYRGTIKAMRNKYPLVDTKWCAGCHDPALLFTGRIDDPDLDFDSPEAMLGLTCMSCHAIKPRSTNGNGDYVMQGRVVYSWERSNDPRVLAAHDILLEAKPDAHIESLRPHNIDKSNFCATCHGAHVPPELNRWKFQRVQDEFHDWHDSGVSLNNVRSFYHPPNAKRCQDCHMPLVPDPEDPSSDENGLVRSHLFAAANTALPFLRGDNAMIERQRQFLQNAVRVDVTGIVLEPEAQDGSERQRLYAPARLAKPAVKPGEIVEAHVVVRNFGVGHKFPGGTKDSNEVWMQFEASIGDGAAFYHSGRIDPETGLVDPAAEFWRAYVLDRDGNRVVNRVGPDVYTKVYVKTIGPGTANVVRYRFQVPEGAKGKLRVKATLRYRKFMREYIDFLYPHDKTIEHPQMDGSIKEVDLTQLPIIDMWTDVLELAVTPEGTTGPAPTPYDVIDPEPRRAAGDIDLPKDRERINDLGIGYLLQGDVYWAEHCFDQVTKIEPEYADGWVNVGRVRIQANNWDGAVASLAEAKRLKPGWAKPRYFEGLMYEQMGRFPQAEAAYREVYETWPNDRATLKSLAKVIWEQALPGDKERPAQALEFLKRMIEIDPEDWVTWQRAIAIYKALEDSDGVDAATRAYMRFKRDDDEQIRAGDARRKDPNLMRQWQKKSTHVQPGLSE
ncbi:MAG: tetratricopeptide repeat protein [Planctomycetota bacterium]|nr:tetratricopeptide repeat protein [Planctomycetota bacterium]